MVEVAGIEPTRARLQTSRSGANYSSDQRKWSIHHIPRITTNDRNSVFVLCSCVFLVSRETCQISPKWWDGQTAGAAPNSSTKSDPPALTPWDSWVTAPRLLGIPRYSLADVHHVRLCRAPIVSPGPLIGHSSATSLTVPKRPVGVPPFRHDSDAPGKNATSADAANRGCRLAERRRHRPHDVGNRDAKSRERSDKGSGVGSRGGKCED